MRIFFSVINMVEVIAVLNVLKTFGEVISSQISTCDNGLGVLTYERLPGFQLQSGHSPDELSRAIKPADVLEECRRACLQNVRVKNNLLHPCSSFDFRPGKMLDSGEFGPSVCRLSEMKAKPLGSAALQPSPGFSHFNEICLPYEHIAENCAGRYYVFDRYPDKALIPQNRNGCVEVPSTGIQHCQRICLASQNPPCLSATYSSINSSCLMCDGTSASHPGALQSLVDHVYMENLCLDRGLGYQGRGKTVFVEEQLSPSLTSTEASSGADSESRIGAVDKLDRYQQVTIEQCKAKCVENKKLQCTGLEFVPSPRNATVGDCFPLEQKIKPVLPSNGISGDDGGGGTSTIMELHCLKTDLMSVPAEVYGEKIPAVHPGQMHFRRESLERSSDRKYLTAFRRHSRKLSEGAHVLTITESTPVQQCLIRCLMEDRCDFVSHSRKFGTCQLLSDSTQAAKLVYHKDFDHYENLLTGESRPKPATITTDRREPNYQSITAGVQQEVEGYSRGSFSGGQSVNSLESRAYFGNARSGQNGPRTSYDNKELFETAGSMEKDFMGGRDRTATTSKSAGNDIVVATKTATITVKEPDYTPRSKSEDRQKPATSPETSKSTFSKESKSLEHSRYSDNKEVNPQRTDNDGFVSLNSIARKHHSSGNSFSNFLRVGGRSSRVLGRDFYSSQQQNDLPPLLPEARFSHHNSIANGASGIPVIRKSPNGGLHSQRLDNPRSSDSFTSLNTNRNYFQNTFSTNHQSFEALGASNQELNGVGQINTGQFGRKRQFTSDSRSYTVNYPTGDESAGAQSISSAAAETSLYAGNLSKEDQSDSETNDNNEKQSRYFGSDYISSQTDRAKSACFSDKFSLKATGRRLKPSLVTEILSVSSLSQCEEACVHTTQYTCSVLSYRYSSSASESQASQDNCELSDTDHVTEEASNSSMLEDNRDFDYYERLLDQQCMKNEISSQSSFLMADPINQRPLNRVTGMTHRRTAQGAIIETGNSLQDDLALGFGENSEHARGEVDQSSAKFIGSVNVLHEGMLNTDGGDVTADCDERGMQLTLNANAPFYGRIYTNGHYDTCSMVGRGERVLTLQISAEGTSPECGTRQMGDSIHNIVVVQFSDFVQTSFDKKYNLTCYIHGPGETVVTSGYISASPGQLSPVIDLPTRELLDSRVRLSIMYDGQPTSTIAVGDPLLFRLDTQSGANLLSDVFAYNVIARDPYSGKSVKLIDEHGCPTDARLFPALQLVRNGNGLQARFNAFKIPQSNYLLFEATVRACRQACPPTQCNIDGAKEMSFGRRRRRRRRRTLSQFQKFPHDENTSGGSSQTPDEHIRKLISVYYTRAEIDKERDAATASASIEARLCMPPAQYRALVASLAILGVTLVSAVVFAIVRIARQRQAKNTHTPVATSIGSQWKLSGWSSMWEYQKREDGTTNPPALGAHSRDH